MKNKQQGGTLLGLILGGLVGLGVALAVAVYITKMPVPFNTKSLSSSAESDAAETMKNKDWDPNATLAGKNPAKPKALAASEAPAVDPAAPASAPASAPTGVLKALPASAPSAPAPATGAASAAKAGSADPLGDLARTVTAPGTPAKARPASGDPIGDLAKAVTARPALPAAPARSQSGDVLNDPIPALPAAKAKPAELMSATQAPDPFHYFVQAGAFRTEEEAAKQRTRLQSLGIHAQVSEREQAGRTVYRVRMGPFDRKEEAEKMTDKLGDNAIDATLIRVQR